MYAKNSFRRRMNACLKILGALTGALLIASPTAFARGGSLTHNEALFVIGYAEYLRGDWGNCADSFYRTSSTSEPLASRSRLYLAFCQNKLNLKPAAAYNLNLVDSSSLKNWEAKTYSTLETALKSEIEKLTAPTFALMPYFGQGTYSTDPSLSSSTFYGLDFETYWKAFAFKASDENLTIKTQGYGDYSQNQYVIGIGAGAWDSEFRLRYIGVTSANKTYDGITAFGLGYSYWAFEKSTRLSVDAYSTKYANSSLGNLNVTQVSATVGKTLYADTDWSLWGQVGGHFVSPTSTLTKDSSTAFTITSSYSRIALDLALTVDVLTASVGYTSGKEVFGIRNDGAVLMSGLQEHQSGYNASVRYAFTPQAALQLGLSQDAYQTGNGTKLVDASVNSFNALGSFYF